MSHAVEIRAIDAASEDEVATVARGMRATLVEVLGPERGEAMYTLDWLQDRVRHHLDPDRCTGAVLVAVGAGGGLVGHTIVRVDEEEGSPVGLMSTTWVVPTERRQGLASRLLAAGEDWMRDRGMTVAVTWTHPGNAGLIALYRRRGYTLQEVDDDFVRLSRSLVPGSLPAV